MSDSDFSVPGVGGLRQLAALAAGFLITGLLFGAGAISAWAQRLSIDESPAVRETLITLSNSWVELLEPTGVLQARRQVMAWRDRPSDESPRASGSGAALNKVIAQTGSVQAMPGPAVPVVATQTADLPAVVTGAKVALVGDSMMAVGLAPNLARELKRAGAREVVRAYRSGAGLARPDHFDWMIEYPRFMAGGPPDWIVCTMGANDAQGFQVGKKIYKFGQPEWLDEYAARVERFLDMLQANSTRVYWVLLPRMRSPVFDERMQSLNRMMQERFGGRPGLYLLEPDPLLLGQQVRRYSEYASDPALKLERLRSEDGIHVTDSGGRRLAAGIVSVIQRPNFAGQAVSR